jgi:uracil-DNA glycosylase family 4
VTASELPPRKHPDAECENCDLYNTGVFVPTKFVGRGRTPNGIAVVGEAPGGYEAATGEPFTGDSGQLLNSVLKYHDIKRQETVLTNACLCRPPGNKTPTTNARRCCRKRLITELRDAGIEKVLALGNPAVHSLMDNAIKISTQRVGRPKESPDGFTVVPSYHPAFCLRSGDNFPYLVNDIRKLVKEMPHWEPPQWAVADSEEDALRAIDIIRNCPERLIVEDQQVLVVDIEYGFDKDNDYDHPDRYQLLCIGVAYAKRKVIVFGERVMQNETVIKALKALFRVSKLCGQNFKSDCSGLFRLMGNLKTWFDTMLAHYTMDERPGNHKLEIMGQEILGTPNWKQAIDAYLGPGKNYAAIPRPELYKYNAYDDSVTWDLMEDFIRELESRNLRSLHDFMARAGDELKFLEINGIGFDRDRSLELSAEYEEILGGLRTKLDALCDPERPDGPYDAKFGGINPNSPKQVTEWLADRHIRVKSTDADTLKALLGRAKPGTALEQFLTLLLEHRYNAKRHGTFVKGMRRRAFRGRVHTIYSLHATTSGRLASRNPNLQNVVRDARIKSQFVVVDAGNVFVGCDFSQAEGRVMCYEARDEYLRGIFADPNRDIFDEMGLDFYPDVPYGKMSKDQRVRIKAIFYGSAYGREAYSIAQEYKLPVRQVEKDMVKFFGLMPQLVAWRQSVLDTVHRSEDLVTAFGRHRRFHLITEKNKKDVENEALSFLPQSTASDITLRALTTARPALRGLGYMRLTIHDQLVAECKEERKEEVAALLTEHMLASARQYTTWVPFKVDVTYGKHWGEL